MFLDLYPEEPLLATNDFYEAHLLRVHSFLYVEQLKPTLILRAIDYRALEKLLANDPNAIKHEEVDGSVLLSASTETLQQFALNHVKAGGVFSSREEFHRVPPTP